MKKYVTGIFIFCLVNPLFGKRHKDEFSQTFMLTRPANQHMSMMQAAWHNFIHDKDGTYLGSLQIISFHLQSDKKEKTKRYFLPKGCGSVIVAGDDVTDEFFTRDVRAEWLGLPSDFRGKLTINPRQKQTGFTIQYHQDIKKFSDSSFLSSMWASLSLPFIYVQNNFNPMQSEISDVAPQQTDGPKDLLEAFNQSTWNFGKFCPHTMSKFDAAELRIDLGTTFLDEDDTQLAYYSFLSIPLSGKQKPHHIFDAYVGYNGYAGFGSGVNIQFPLNKDRSHVAWCFFLDLEASWLFDRKQLRTFDLRDKPWSRFLPFNRKDGPTNQNIPGVNMLTLCVEVKPYGIADFSAGWRVKMGHFEFEASYGVWGHAEERVKLRDDMKEFTCLGEFGIAGEGSIDNKGKDVAASSSHSTINCQAEDDDDFVLVTLDDIDFQSGVGTSALNHKIQIAANMQRKDVPVETFFGIGTFVDFPQKNAALKVWGVWVKCGASF